MKFNYRNNNFVYMYARLRRLYRKYSSNILKKFNFTQSEIDILTFLNNNYPNFNTASDITKYKGVSKGLVSKSVNSLIDQGLLISRPNEKDARVLDLYITGQADFLVKELEIANQSFHNRLIEGLDPKDLEIFYDVNRKILDNLSQLEMEEDL